MNLKPWWGILVLWPMAACAASPIASGAGKHDRFGWMVGHCVALKQARVGASQAVTIVELDDDASRTSRGVISGRAAAGEVCPPLLPDRKDINTAGGNHFYFVTTPRKIGSAIAILGDASTQGMEFHSCNTTEGIRFTVSNGRTVVWNGYYYLGYDTTPTCAGGGAE